MGALRDSILSVPNWEQMTSAEIVAALARVEVRPFSSEWTYKGIAKRLGLETMLTLRAELIEYRDSGALGLEATRLIDFTHSQLEGNGIDFSDPVTLAGVEQFKNVPDLAPYIPALKSLGVEVVEHWSDLTADEVTTEVAAIKVDLKKQADSNQWMQSVMFLAGELQNGHTDLKTAYDTLKGMLNLS